MKRIILKELLLISLKEKRARRISFDRSRTILIGDNKTGKSSILKSIYSTFGAIPSKIDPGWLSLNIASCVKFQIDQDEYTIVKNGSVYALFEAQNNLLKCSNKVSDFTELYSALFNFKITGTLSLGTSTTLPIQYMIAPFYIDQDASWADNWNSFSKLTTINNGRNILINYFAGLRTNRYYDTVAKIKSLKINLENIEQQKNVTKSVLIQVQSELTNSNFNFDVELFRDETNEMLRECELLQNKQEVLKNSLIDLQENKLNKEIQFKLAEKGLKECRHDYQYATETQLKEEIECPTCGAQYRNSIIERFELSNDEGSLEELLSIINGEILGLNSLIEIKANELSSMTSESVRIQQLLNVKKENLQFRDILEVQGRNELRRIFNKNFEEINDQYYRICVNFIEQQNILKSIDDKTRKKRIKGSYFEYMTTNLKALGSYVTQDMINDIFEKPKQTGSELPRTLLAYYFTIFKLILEHQDVTFWPIIIDAPCQQEPDKEHIEKTIKFLDEFQPEHSQMIIGVRDLAGIEIAGKKIYLDEPENTLSEAAYVDVLNEIQPFFQLMRTNDNLF